MYVFDPSEYYADELPIITTFRGTVVRMYAWREDRDRQVSNAGGGGYDRRGTCLANFLQASFQPELLKIHRRAHSAYSVPLDNKQAGGYRRLKREGEHAYHGNRGGLLYGMTAYYRRGERVAYRINLDGACGWDSICRVAEAIGLRVTFGGETRDAYIHVLHGLEKVRARREVKAQVPA